jgi:hypothetical protein
LQRRLWPGEVKALGYLASQPLQRLQLIKFLDPLGHSAEAKVTSQQLDRPNQSARFGAFGDVSDEGLIDLERIDGYLGVMRESCVRRLEVKSPSTL